MIAGCNQVGYAVDPWGSSASSSSAKASSDPAPVYTDLDAIKANNNNNNNEESNNNNSGLFGDKEMETEDYSGIHRSIESHHSPILSLN